MKYRAPAKNYDLFSALSSQRKNWSHKRGILKLREVIDWAAFDPLLEEVAGYSQKDAKKGGGNGSARLFKAFGEILAGQGLIAKEGSIVDASFVDAPPQRNSREAKQAD